MISDPARIAWHRRLVTRLALVGAVAMLVFWALAGPVTRAVAELVAPQEFVYEVAWARDALLGHARREGPGHWVPDEEGRRAVGSDFAISGAGYVWTTTAGGVVCGSDDLPWTAGTRWPFALAGRFDVSLPGGRTAPAVGFALPWKGEVAGYLIAVLLDPVQHARYFGVEVDQLDRVEESWFAVSPGTPLLSDLEAERIESRVALVFGAVAVVALASILAWTGSRLVTRRLSRMAAEAAKALEEEAPLPGPFVEEGRDEVAALARAMNSMRARLQESLAARAEAECHRREWIAQISHDLRTPLTALIACLDRAEGALREPDPQRLREQLEELLAVARLDAERIQSLTDDLLEIARLERGAALRREPVPPGELARQAVRSLEPLAQQCHVAVRTVLGRGLPVLEADGGRLLRALENLLRNAIRHARTRVELVVSETAEGVRFEVRDDGPGFAGGGQASLEVLGDDARRRGSAGLGLVVVARVAQAHAGRMGVANGPDGGAIAWFSIPREAAG